MDYYQESKSARPLYGPESSTRDITVVLNLGDLLTPRQLSQMTGAQSLTDIRQPTTHSLQYREEYSEDHAVSRSNYDLAKFEHRPIQRSPARSRQSVNKTNSTGSTQSAASSQSSGSSCTSPDLKSKSRRQKASKESLKTFLQKHENAMSAAIFAPKTDANPYKESWIKKKHYLSFTKQHSVRDVKFDAAGNMLLSTRNSVQFYDGNGMFQQRVYINRVTEPWGLHVNTAKTTVLVSDYAENCVKEFNPLGILVQEYGPIPKPTGVTVSQSDYVFICSELDACVYVFDKKSRLVTKLGEGVLTKPAYICVHNKLVLVSDESKVIGFNIQDDIEFVYGKSDESKHPASLCVDATTGYVLATHYYHDQVIAIRKDMSRALHVKDATRPTLIAISPYGNLLVGEKDSSRGITNFRMYRLEYNNN